MKRHGWSCQPDRALRAAWRVRPVLPVRPAPHLATWLTVLLLAGCGTATTVAPPSQAPAPLIAERFPEGATTAAVSTEAAPDLAWNRFFTDTRLQALIRLALDHNRDLRVAALNVEQARAQAAIRDTDLWPTVNAGLGGTRVPTNTGGVSSTVTGGLTTTAYEVDLFGRVRQQAQVAQEQLRASEFLRSAAQSSLIAAVGAAYVNLQADEALLRITQETLRSREEGLQIVQGRIKAGAGSALDEAQAQASLQAARAALAQVQRQMAVDESSLVLLLGRPLPAGLRSSGGGFTSLSDPNAAPPPPLRADLPSAVLARRPDIGAAEAQLRAAQANVEAARSALYPRISLTASFGQASRDLSSLFAGGTWVWGVTPQLLAPIFDAGRARAGMAQASAAQQSALAQYEKAVQAAFKEVHDALVSRSTLVDQQRALQAQVQAESERLRLAQTRWRLGASAYLDVLDAQRSLYAAQTALVQTQAQVLISQGTLYKALGGGAL